MFSENITNILPCFIYFISICLSLIIGGEFHKSRISLWKNKSKRILHKRDKITIMLIIAVKNDKF